MNKDPGFLGRLLRYHREKRGMSLQDVADEAGTTKAHIWDMEKGNSRNPTAQTIMGLSIALEINPSDILACAMADLPNSKFEPPKLLLFRPIGGPTRRKMG